MTESTEPVRPTFSPERLLTDRLQLTVRLDVAAALVLLLSRLTGPLGELATVYRVLNAKLRDALVTHGCDRDVDLTTLGLPLASVLPETIMLDGDFHRDHYWDEDANRWRRRDQRDQRDRRATCDREEA